MNARTRLVALPVAAVLALGAAGCGSGDQGGGSGDETPAQALASARKTLDATSGVSVSLATKDLPSGVTGITTATGTGVHPSAFEGTFELSYKGLPAEVAVVAVAGKTYAKNALLLPDWTSIDPGDYGAPDPNDLMSPDSGFAGLLAATTDATRGKSVRGGKDNKEVLTSYAGKLPAAAVQAIVPSASGDFTVTYTLTDKDELREAVIKGVFYQGNDANTYDLELDDYGTTKDITAP